MPRFLQTAVRRAVVRQGRLSPTEIKDLSKTLHLPKSTFPARASPADLTLYRQRCADDLYKWQKEHRDGKAETFILHDGPPYANGHVHVGHALNKILKDLILRFELARGKRVLYRPGWDCHGLPIELKALQQAASRKDTSTSETINAAQKINASVLDTKLSPADIRSRARKLASKTIDLQRKSFQEWGVMGDWEQPYRTMDADFELRQLRVFHDMLRKGLISRHNRPVYWSPSSRTALAEAELEYDDSHKCEAAFVKMPFLVLPDILRTCPAVVPGRVSALIWTTTPWTLPANKAVAFNDSIDYVLLELQNCGSMPADQILVAQDRVEHIGSFLPKGTTVNTLLSGISGEQLRSGNPQCWNAFQDAASPMVAADFVTATSGTGLVHMAPGHGMEDWQVCQNHGIGPAFAPVDDEGKFTSEVTASKSPSLAGLDAQTEGVNKILEALGQPDLFMSDSAWDGGSPLLLASHSFTHKNPIDWRTKQPVIVRATAQWFADVSVIRDRALQSLRQVSFLPDTGRTRLNAFLQGRSQWCISRQRAWGVPIPALYSVETGEACVSEESVQHILSVMEQRGADAWFVDVEHEPAWLHASLEPGKWTRGRDTMDVWFDSGTTWTSLPLRGGKAVSDVCLEGTDQHRGWFQSSLLTSISTQDENKPPHAPYEMVVTHGFTLDADSRKMSKSLGNVISPHQIIAGTLLPPIKPKKQKTDVTGKTTSGVQYDSLGPDALRLWVASSDYTRDVTVALPVLNEVQQALQKYRVTFRFLLGVLEDYPSTTPDLRLLAPKLGFADSMVLCRLAQCSRAVFQAYSGYGFHRGIKEINTLIYNDLSAFYFEICKDRLYTDARAVRQSTQTILLVIFRELLRMLSPAAPHLVEEVWYHTPEQLRGGDETHPLRQGWAEPFEFGSVAKDQSEGAVVTAMGYFRSLSDAVKGAQEEARKAGRLKSGLASEVHIQAGSSADPEFLKALRGWDANGELAELLVVSQARLNGSDEAESASTWSYQQDITGHGTDKRGTVTVLSPAREKCSRCWRSVAEEPNSICGRCQKVLAEE